MRSLDSGSLSVIAHRGAWGMGVPENSIAAFERAIEFGADMIEFDVRRTGDDQLVIFHDEDLGGIPLAELTRADVTAQIGMAPPLLTDVLELAAGRIALDVELKEDGYVERVVPLLSRHVSASNSIDAQMIVTSFIDRVLGQIRALDPGLRTGLLLQQVAGHAVERAQTCRAQVLLPSAALAGDALIAATESSGLDCIVWDFLRPRDDALVSDERICGVITDDVPATCDLRDRVTRYAARR